MGNYTYLACDLVTNQVIAELPLTQVEAVRSLDDVGTFRGKLKLTDPNAWKVGPLTGSQPGRTALYVDLNGTLVWGGIIWTRGYTASTGLLDLQGLTFESYFDHRVLTVTAGAGTLWTSPADQLAIVQALVNWLQSVGGGNIGIVVPTPASGILVSASWNSYEYKVIGDAIRELSQADQGFDWAVDVAYVAGVPTKTLTLSFPRRGAAFTSSGLVFEFEAAGAAPDGTGLRATGNVYDYDWPEDATVEGITIYETGAGSGTTMLTSSYTTPALIDGGYPLLEQVYSHKDVAVQSRLNALAIAEGKSAANPVALPCLYTRPDYDPVLGSYTIGDDCRVRILDYRFNSGLDGMNNPIAPGLDQFWRILQTDLKAGWDQVDSVALTLGPPPPS